MEAPAETAAAESKAEAAARQAQAMMDALRNQLEEELRIKMAEIKKRKELEEMNLNTQLVKTEKDQIEFNQLRSRDLLTAQEQKTRDEASLQVSFTEINGQLNM